MFLEARLGVEKRLVQIVVPNTEKEEIPDICDIVYDFIQGKTLGI